MLSLAQAAAIVAGYFISFPFLCIVLLHTRTVPDLAPKPEIQTCASDLKALASSPGQGTSKASIFGGYIGVMENKMETTIVYWGLYWGNGKENGNYLACFGVIFGAF